MAFSGVYGLLSFPSGLHSADLLLNTKSLVKLSMLFPSTCKPLLSLAMFSESCKIFKVIQILTPRERLSEKAKFCHIYQKPFWVRSIVHNTTWNHEVFAFNYRTHVLHNIPIERVTNFSLCQVFNWYRFLTSRKNILQ